MNYMDIINLIFAIILGIYSLMVLHFVVFFIIGLFKGKKFPETTVMNKYGLIIPARNEENVVGNLIESIQKCKYPQDKLHIFVIAHNCTDKTAEVARKYGVTVYEYNNPNECTMGYAFRYLFKQIEKDYETSSFDGFFLFNADNVVAEDYFNKMNDAFQYYNKKNVITSFRNGKNFGANLISALYGLYFVNGCRFESRGRSVCGCSTRVQGTGYVISSDVVKNGWNYVTLTEDWEFTTDQILNNNRIVYCDEAEFFDEQPTSMKIMWRQRVRWSRGHWLVFVQRIKDLFKGLFNKEINHKFSLYDITMNILPFCLILLGINVLHFILLLFTPLFSDISLRYVFFDNPSYGFLGDIIAKMAGVTSCYDVLGEIWTKLLFGNAYMFGLARTFILYLISMSLWGALTFIVEHKRIKNISLGLKILAALCWPLFLIIQFLIDIQAVLSKNLGWKPIPHKDKTNINNLK